MGALSANQAGGNLVASAVAGVLWTTVSPAAGFIYVAALMTLSLPVLASDTRSG